jgi:hypothetical protein
VFSAQGAFVSVVQFAGLSGRALLELPLGLPGGLVLAVRFVICICSGLCLPSASWLVSAPEQEYPHQLIISCRVFLQFDFHSRIFGFGLPPVAAFGRA